MNFTSFLAGKILQIFGWQITGSLPSTPKGIFVVVPHTHWLDFPLGLLARRMMNMDIRFIGKKSLFSGLKGHIFRWLGGYPVDRDKSTGYVSAVADIFNQHDQFYIAIAPEGTRKKVTHLKTGFYYIAIQAGVPMYLTRFNFGEKKIELSNPVYADPSRKNQLEEIEQYFRGVKGKVPELSF